jgi:hypothetical protein
MTFFLYTAQILAQTPAGFTQEFTVSCVGRDEVQGAAEAVTVASNLLKGFGGGQVLDVLGLSVDRAINLA